VSRFTKMWYRSLLAHLLPVVAIGPGSRVLEIGSGYGYLAPFVIALGAQYFGLDLATSAVAQIPALNNCHGLVANGCELPFSDHRFDVVICMEVIEHLERPDLLVSECRRVASAGARLVFSCPSYMNLFLPLKWLADLGVPWCKAYLVRQPIDRTTTALYLLRILETHRLRILARRAVRLAPPLFERLEKRLPWVNDLIFKVEDRFGERFPLRLLGLHTIYVAMPV
jgi:SAM-dependent methyltransferase